MQPQCVRRRTRKKNDLPITEKPARSGFCHPQLSEDEPAKKIEAPLKRISKIWKSTVLPSDQGRYLYTLQSTDENLKNKVRQQQWQTLRKKTLSTTEQAVPITNTQTAFGLLWLATPEAAPALPSAAGLATETHVVPAPISAAESVYRRRSVE